MKAIMKIVIVMESWRYNQWIIKILMKRFTNQKYMSISSETTPNSLYIIGKDVKLSQNKKIITKLSMG